MRASRDKLINAVVYFATHANYCGKIKLFKLLYLLDFEHFSQTGKSVTGFEYQAWKFGPVPVELMQEWEDLGADLSQAIHIQLERVIDYERQTVKVNDGVAFDDDLFTPRQIRIMERIAEQYRDTRSPAMIDVTHAQNGAWDRVWRQGQGQFSTIPYDLALPDNAPHRDDLIQIGAEQRMYQAALLAGRTLEEIPSEY